ncbi:MAG: FeoA family protein [Kouleothrix sp.]
MGYAGTLRLDRAEPGSRFMLRRIVEEAEEDSELMRHLQNNGLTPGAVFEVLEQSPAYGVALRDGERTIMLSAQIAAVLWGERA